MTTSILPTDFDQQIADASDCSQRSLRRLHAALAQTFQSRRNEVLGALYDAANGTHAEAAKLSANIYLRLRDNITVTFNCSDETADGFLHALWDQSAEVDDALGELLDRVADTIGGWE